MSSTSGVTNQPLQTPAYDEASGVVAQIQNQIGSISDLFAQIQDLLNEIQAASAERPDPNSSEFKDKDGNFDASKFGQAMTAFTQKINDLNTKLESTYRKLGTAQAVLQRMQNQDLPAANRRDAERLQKSMKDATEALNGAARTLADGTQGGDDSRTSSKAETHIEIKLRQKNIELKMKKDPSFKEVISIFQLMAVVVGSGTPEQKFTKVPPAAAGGLPPVSTP